MLLPTYRKTPLIEISTDLLTDSRIRLLVKREDMNHPFVSGNKWWKLKYNLLEAQRQKQKTLLTFGGAYSNHIYAVAAAARELDIQSIGIIRGERTEPLNATLQFAEEQGMQLQFISREQYRGKTEKALVDSWRNRWGDFYLIPEGGTNALAVRGCEELGAQLKMESHFDFLCLPVATAGTMAGLVNSMAGTADVIGYAALKGGEFLKDEVKRYSHQSRWRIEAAYHFGGYGKVNEQLRSFILQTEKQLSIPLDPVYTAKALFGVIDQIKKNVFPAGSTILFLHTGGLQGRKGFNF